MLDLIIKFIKPARTHLHYSSPLPPPFLRLATRRVYWRLQITVLLWRTTHLTVVFGLNQPTYFIVFSGLSLDSQLMVD